MSSPLTGLVELVSRPLFRTARVEAVEDLTPRVRLVDLAVDGVEAGSARAGDKVQVRMAGLTLRTYTPVPRQGSGDGFALVAFAHGEGPGAAWVQTLAVGDEAELFGPRRSLDCSGLTGSVLVVGDETSVGLAAAIGSVEGADVRFVAEATEPDDVRVPAARLGVDLADVVVRAAGGAHRAALSAAVAGLLDGDTTLVVSGDAATVAAVRRHLKDEGVVASRTLAKAYWAEGRRGLD